MENENIEIVQVVDQPKKTKKTNSTEYNKNYYQNNKDKINAKLKTKILCPYCDKLQTHQHMNRHQETKLCKSIQKRKIERQIFEDNIKSLNKYKLD